MDQRLSTLIILFVGLQLPALAADKAPCGRLSQHDGIRVLEVWGSPAEAGYAQGYLLAEDIVALFDRTILQPPVGAAPEAYEAVLLPAVRRHFRWSPAQEAELAGILRGLRARLGDDALRSAKLNRALTVDDVKLVNALADWRGVFCSTFSAWGAQTTDGQTITARNLDYPSTQAMRKSQLILVHRGEKDGHPWCGVSWPGLVGVYTGLSDAGVTINMHDANGLPTRDVLNLTPRSLALRTALEAADAASALKDVEHVFRRHRVLVGNNIHVSRPVAAASLPAGVFEYDGNPASDGVTLRIPPKITTAAGPTSLVCTNHMRQRRSPSDCGRYETLTRGLAAHQRANKPLDVPAALKLIRQAANDTTLHTVVFVPHERAMHVYIPELNDEPVKFDLAAWLKKPVPARDEPAATSSSKRYCPLEDRP